MHCFSYRLDTLRLAGFPYFIFPSFVRQLQDSLLVIYMGSIELIQYLMYVSSRICLGSYALAMGFICPASVGGIQLLKAYKVCLYCR
jgi:hypothetical protein